MGDDGLSCAAATEDGGLVVGGNSNGTYNGIASEGLVDFVAIKLGTNVNRGACWRVLVAPRMPHPVITATMTIATATSVGSTQRITYSQNCLSRAARPLFSPPALHSSAFGVFPRLDGDGDVEWRWQASDEGEGGLRCPLVLVPNRRCHVIRVLTLHRRSAGAGPRL